MRTRWTLVLEVEQVKKVANGRPVGWNIVANRRVVRRVWQVIAAAPGDRRQAPVVFDELQNRNMVRIVVRTAIGNGCEPPDRRAPLARTWLSTSYRPSGLLVLPLLPIVIVPEVE